MAAKEPNMICQLCGSAYYRKPSHMKGSKYCSKACFDKAQFKGKIKICATCGKEIRVPISELHEHNFCSKECRLSWQSTNIKQTINVPGRNIKRAQKDEKRRIIYEAALNNSIESKGNKNGYIQMFGLYVHRVVAEQKIGRRLRIGEIVHHIDGNRHNNHPDNLMVFPNASEHHKWHWEHDSNFNKKEGDAT